MLARKLLVLGLAVLLAAPLFSAAKAFAAEAKKPLVVYFSHSGHTKTIAEMIHQLSGGELLQIKTVEPYPDNYDECVDLAKKQQMENARPAIETRINPDDYSVIFLGFPNWWSSMPMPVYTFVEENKLNGHTIIPFMTHGGGGQAHAVSDLKKICPKSNILPALAISGTSAKSAFPEVEKWYKNLKLN